MAAAPPIFQFTMTKTPLTTPQYVISDYYPSWKVYNGRKPSDLRLGLLTHLNYAFAAVAEDGTHRDVKADTEVDVDGTRGALPALVKLRDEKCPHLQILLSIGGGSGSANFASVAADKNRTARFCESAKNMVLRFGLDGIDIDWEHPKTAGEGASFGRLVTALRRYLPRPRYTITAALPAGEWCLRHIDLSSMLRGPNSTLNHINIMTYDFAGSWTNGQSGHHASLFTPARPHNEFAKRSILRISQYLIRDRKIDPSKIVIGIPVYGRGFVGTKGPGEKFAACTTYEYQQLPLQGAPEQVDEAIGAASCYGLGGDQLQWVSYDNPETVRGKTGFVVENKIGGLFFWTSALDAEEDDRSLLFNVYQNFYRSG